MRSEINRRILNVLCVLMVAVCLASCGTKKAATSEKKLSAYNVERVVENTAWKGGFSSKIKVNIQFASGTYALSGTLRIKKDEALQLSLQVPLLGMEAVRIEATPQKIVVIDRLHKKYVEESVAELSELSGAGLNYYALQALFTGMVFRPGVKTLTSEDAERMVLTKNALEGILCLMNSEKGLEYAFNIQSLSNCASQTTIRKAEAPYKCTWQYIGSQKFAGSDFPLTVKASFEGISKPVAFEIELSRFSSSSDWTAGAPLSTRYERIQLKDVMKLFSTL